MVLFLEKWKKSAQGNNGIGFSVISKLEVDVIYCWNLVVVCNCELWRVKCMLTVKNCL